MLCIQNSFELTCYTCNEFDNSPNCGDTLSGQEASLGLTTVCPAGDKCVVFQNPQDGYTWRACSSDVNIKQKKTKQFSILFLSYNLQLQGLLANVST